MRSKWEPWLLGAISALMIFFSVWASELRNWKMVLSIFILALVVGGSHYFAARFAPLKVKDSTKHSGPIFGGEEADIRD